MQHFSVESLPQSEVTEKGAVICDASIISSYEIDYSPFMNIEKKLQDKSFLKAITEELQQLSEEENTSLTGLDGCYLSTKQVLSFDALSNGMRGVIYVYFFTADREEAGYFIFTRSGFSALRELVFYNEAVNCLDDEDASEKYIRLVYNFRHGYLSQDNTVSGITSSYFQIVGDYYHALDYETLAISYEEIVAEENLLWISFQ